MSLPVVGFEPIPLAVPVAELVTSDGQVLTINKFDVVRVAWGEMELSVRLAELELKPPWKPTGRYVELTFHGLGRLLGGRDRHLPSGLKQLDDFVVDGAGEDGYRIEELSAGPWVFDLTFTGLSIRVVDCGETSSALVD